MDFIRNTLGVALGLLTAALIITLGIRINPEWVTYEEFSPFRHWAKFLRTVHNKDWLFLNLLFFSGLSTSLGGIVTALIVPYGKVAYAMLIGFIMLFLALLDIIIFPYHPTFYKIGIFLTFFPSAWFGGKMVELIYKYILKKNIGGL